MSTISDTRKDLMMESDPVKCFGFDAKYMQRVRVPAGFLCAHCDEAIGETDRGYWAVVTALFRGIDGTCHVPYHRACFGRLMLGGVAHAQKTCRCFGGNGTDLDPPGLTKRQAALAAEQIRSNGIGNPFRSCAVDGWEP